MLCLRSGSAEMKRAIIVWKSPEIPTFSGLPYTLKSLNYREHRAHRGLLISVSSVLPVVNSLSCELHADHHTPAPCFYSYRPEPGGGAVTGAQLPAAVDRG